MNEPNRPFRRVLRACSAMARWVVWMSLAACVVLTLAWGVLRWGIVPRIGDYRPWLETRATRMVGAPVRIGKITAVATGWMPALALEDVVLLDPEGREALRLTRVQATMSWRSVWNRGFEQLTIDAPVLDVRRAADGSIFVGGLGVSGGGSADNVDSAAADWLFSQSDLVVRRGTLRWTDEQRGAPPLQLDAIDVVIRNQGWRHAMRLDATPPAQWGDRFRLVGQFRQPIFSLHNGRWQDWVGQIHANFARVDVSQLRRYADPGFEIARGQGAMRLWIDVERGRLAGATADVAMVDVETRLGPQLPALALSAIQGRVSGRHWNEGNFEVATAGLQFTTRDGQRWPGGNASVRYLRADGSAPARGEFKGDQLDLAALRELGSRLPLGDAAHRALAGYAPQGVVQTVRGDWTGAIAAPNSYALRGRVERLGINARPLAAASAAGPAQGESPGLRGATIDFQATQAGGRATIALRDGAVEFPGVFEEAVVPIDRLDGTARWKLDGERVSVQVDDLRFANADASGNARAEWRTGDGTAANPAYPGVLDLSGSLQRANGTRVHRYLPAFLPQEVRHYVRDGVSAGVASDVRFKVRGDLRHMPFSNPKQGEFRIVVPLKGVDFAYVPKSLQAAKELPWPALTQMEGDLVFDRASMAVRNARSRMVGAPGTVITSLEALIPDLEHTVVSVTADANGPLADVLSVVRQSPLAAMTGNAAEQATVAGPGQYKLRLTLPVEAIDKARIQGSITVAGGSDFRYSPDSPPLSKIRGTLQFGDTGFSIAGMQAQALGGEMRIDGGLRSNLPPQGAEPTLQLRGVGTATADGLRAARELGMVSQLAEMAQGSAGYSASLAVRKGVPELSVTSSLQGLQLTLPAPLAKAAGDALALRFSTRLLSDRPTLQDRLQLELGRKVALTYERSADTAAPRVLRGSIAVGDDLKQSLSVPADGVAALVDVDRVDMDAWRTVLSRAAASVVGTAVAAPVAADSADSDQYLPSRWAVRTGWLKVAGRELHDVVVGGSREGSTWRANLDAEELNGYMEYREAGKSGDATDARVYARLARLRIPQAATADVEDLLDGQPGAIPALDIVVEDFELRGRKLGRIEVDAVNRGSANAQREWRLNKLNITTPEAIFTATGNWTMLGAQGTGVGPRRKTADAASGISEVRRTVLNFKLDIRDSGELLGRFGMGDVVRRGRGRMDGQLAWVGSPLALDYPSMAGQLNLNVESGQFLKVEPGFGKLLSVLSLQSLPRRFKLDFRDVFSEGFAFDFVRGDVQVGEGIATTNNLQMKGVNAAVLMDGHADIASGTQDLRVVVVPEINAGTASLVATAINPALGLGTFLAQVFLRGPLTKAATQEFHIDGTWADPRVTKVTGAARAGVGTNAATPAPAPWLPSFGDTGDNANRSTPEASEGQP